MDITFWIGFYSVFRERKKDMERIVRIAVIQLGLESVVYRDNESSVYGESALRILE